MQNLPDTSLVFTEAHRVLKPGGRFIVVEPDGEGGIQATDAYYPWYVGAGAILRMRLDPGEPFAHFKPGVYQGRIACAACHTQETQGWLMSHHSIAYGTLYKRERAGDLKCVGCHVTGYRQPGGPVRPRDVAGLRDVQCEACHGPALAHAKDPVNGPKPARVPSVDTCTACHDGERDDGQFDREAYWPRIVHEDAGVRTTAP